MQWVVEEGSFCSRRDEEGGARIEWLLSYVRCWLSSKLCLGLILLVCCL
jgi:hypothetical protein